MSSQLKTQLRELSTIQRSAVDWDSGALLVLAGPGSGKTRVLTCRAARLLDRSRDERFRILALTFTNKAAHEMSTRVSQLVPDLEERADIHTFHSFCAQVIRQHGAHLGIKSDFAIFSQISDRQAVLGDALRRCGGHVDREDIGLLSKLDELKMQLVQPEQAEEWLTERKSASPEDVCRLARAYRLYEAELRRSNALDSNSLIFEAYRLFRLRAIVNLYRVIYRYWLVDEFQDTNGAQYKLLRRMAGESFRNLLAVADDDQTIYEWNGANVSRIKALVVDFDCQVVQLPTNYRCPQGIVDAANRLISYNVQRTPSKRPAEPTERDDPLDNPPIRCRVFDTDCDEAAGIAAEISKLDSTRRAATLVLARTRRLLSLVRDALQEDGVAVRILNRRDEFATPEVRWLVACLKQIERPLDRRNLAELAESFDSFALRRIGQSTHGPSELDLDALMTRSATDGVTYLSAWTGAVQEGELPPQFANIVDVVARLHTREVTLDSAMESDPRSIREQWNPARTSKTTSVPGGDCGSSSDPITRGYRSDNSFKNWT